jgi:hypothetical protein
MTEIERRVVAVNATRARFAGRAFAWGTVDCAKVVAWHLRKMGHRIGISKAGSYSTALSAKRALARWGVETLTEALDKAMLDRIPPAAALAGDVVQLPGTDAFDALAVVAGNGAVLGFHEDSDTLEVVRLDVVPLAAWRA